MRPTKITPKVRDLSSVIPPRAFEVPPFTLPVEDPQAFFPSKDHPIENCQPFCEKETIAATDSPGQSLICKPSMVRNQTTNSFQRLCDQVERSAISN